jgi:transcription antitermination factor NusG
MTANQSWNVVRARSLGEKSVNARLARLGAETFLPLVVTRQYSGRRRKMVESERCLFPRYLFVRSLDIFAACYGLAAVVRSASGEGEPAVAPERLLDEMRELAEPGEEDGVFLIDEKRLEKRNGKRLIRSGFAGEVGDRLVLRDEAPYFGQHGQITSIVRHGNAVRVRALMSILGASREVSVPIAAISELIAAT